MITHPGPSGSPSFLGPPPGHMAGPPPSMGTVMPPPGLTPPMDPGSLTPDPSLMPPQMSMTPNGPMIPIYGPGGMPLTNAGPPMTGPSPSSLSPQQLDGRLSGPPPSMPPHPGIGHFQRRISLPPVDFKIYEMCRRLQQKPDVRHLSKFFPRKFFMHFLLHFFIAISLVYRAVTTSGGTNLCLISSKTMQLTLSTSS